MKVTLLSDWVLYWVPAMDTQPAKSLCCKVLIKLFRVHIVSAGCRMDAGFKSISSWLHGICSKPSCFPACWHFHLYSPLLFACYFSLWNTTVSKDSLNNLPVPDHQKMISIFSTKFILFESLLSKKNSSLWLIYFANLHTHKNHRISTIKQNT